MLPFREQSKFFPVHSVGNHFCTIRYPKCVCETHLKDSIAPSVIVLHFREQFSFPVFLVGNHICTIRYLKCVCVCVCVRHTLKRQCHPKCSCASFQRTVYARWQCVVFSREQFYAHWQCAIFSREQFIFPVPCKGISFIPLVFSLVLCVTV